MDYVFEPSWIALSTTPPIDRILLWLEIRLLHEHRLVGLHLASRGARDCIGRFEGSDTWIQKLSWQFVSTSDVIFKFTISDLSLSVFAARSRFRTRGRCQQPRWSRPCGANHTDNESFPIIVITNSRMDFFYPAWSWGRCTLDAWIFYVDTLGDNLLSLYLTIFRT
jgi:hypothetical protein